MASGATVAAANIGMTIAKRPSEPGTAGKSVELKTNFIPVSKFDFPKVHYYSFEVSERKKKSGKKDTAKVFEQMKLKKKFGPRVIPVFDGGQVYSSEQFDIGHSKQTRNHEVKINDGGREKDFRVEIKYQGDIELRHIEDYVKVDSDTIWDGPIQNNLTVLNAFANSKARSLYLSVGKKAVFPPLKDQYNNLIKILLPGGVEMKQGFYQSIRPGWGKLIINVDICAATFYPDGPIISILPKLFKNKMARHERTLDELRRGIDRRDNDALNWFLKGVTIQVTHRSDNRKPKYKVSYVDSQPADLARFKHDNKDITVAQYFKDAYGRTLQYGRLPCIVIVKPDKSKSYFPLEVCEICPGQKYEVNKLSEDARREMVQKTAIRPYERFDRIEKAIKEIFQHDKDENLLSVGMSVKPDFIRVRGRVLQPPKLSTPNGEITPQEGRWDLRRFIKCSQLYNWSVIVFENKHYAPVDLIRNSIKQLCSSLSERGMDVFPDPPIEYGNPHGGYDKSLYLAAQRARIRKDRPAQLILCVIQKKVMGISGIHATIKRVCGTQLGIISQCVVFNNMKGPNPSRWRQICGNISLKINGKLGGKNFTLADRELNFETKQPYMVFGADVFHPGREEKGRPSVAAVCASVDKSVTKYISRYSMNRKIKNETIENLEGMAVELLKQFQSENSLLPQQIVFYRDGVAEGQFQHVVNKEVEALKRAFDRVYIDKSQKTQKPQLPQLTFIIVQKRHHARFMPVQKTDSDRSGNCRPGTIVDTEIVVPQEFDFYLQSHASPLGTARPTHYNVLLNEAKFSVDAIQTLTYKLCHLSARCNLAISHVTPVHYAHNIANQVKHFVTWDGGRSGSSGGRGHGNHGNNDMVPNTTKCEKLKPEIENRMFFV